MKILMVSSEAAPFAKEGGLGDVVSALSVALATMGHEVRVLMPFYGSLRHRERLQPMPAPFKVSLREEAWARLWQYSPQKNLTYYFIEHDRYFARPELYHNAQGSFADNPERFAFLSRAAMDLPFYLQWFPDVFHVHDWMASLVPVYLETTERHGRLGSSASVLTIHNLAHQGYAPRSILSFANLPDSLYQSDRLEACGGVNFLKGGIYFANKLTTVSPSYAEEIKTPSFGNGLDHVLRFRGGDLIGILNGLDDQVWNPMCDRYLQHHFSRNKLADKELCKADVVSQMGWNPKEKLPLFCAISRLYDQKGLDILADIVPWLIHTMQIRLLILGSGAPGLESHFRFLEQCFPERIKSYIGYSEELAHRMEAGADFLIMPSRFEPCGLNQLYSMRYGTLPIVRATGGLKDSVINYDEATGAGTGFVFQDLTHQSLYSTIGWACATYYDRPKALVQLRKNAMAKDFTWKQSAQRYQEVYQWARESKGLPRA